ncbi:MAG: Unknown protein [uncultured Thiotrichaceae bacterium]|uniref:diguanylate cyclase n=1 Tax=uncultured Thiotrichaceae bacterium TaxID=298394 RepID=A0A6S6TEK7_9GAMM|nr:MAG: Unknown protein [uncultured Thiotrichaceae bacterium]
MGIFSGKPLFSLLTALPVLLGVITIMFVFFSDKSTRLSYSISIPLFWFSLFLLISAVISGIIVFMIMRNQLNRSKRLSNRDELTGLYGAREINRFLRYDVERLYRYNGDLSLILLDIDNFSALNDEYGVKNGDVLLQQLSRLLLKGIKYVNKEEKEFHGIRNSDIAFRYENQGRILIILPETHAKGAYIAAERIREAIMFTEFTMHSSDKKLRTTVSASVVSFRTQDDTVESLLSRAGTLLQKAKITQNSIVMENPLSTIGTPYDVTLTESTAV